MGQVVWDYNNFWILKWKDNKSVVLLSSCVGSELVPSCNGWLKEDRKNISVQQPYIVHSNNGRMSGADLCDKILTYSRCTLKTNKCPLLVFTTSQILYYLTAGFRMKDSRLMVLRYICHLWNTAWHTSSVF